TGAEAPDGQNRIKVSASGRRPWMAALEVSWWSWAGADPALPVGGADMSGGHGWAEANQCVGLRDAAMDGRSVGGLVVVGRSRSGFAGRRSRYERRPRM